MKLNKGGGILKCLVTGATGHIGNVLVKQLYQQGHDVTALVLPKDKAYMIEAYARIIYGNILDMEFLLQNVVDFDVVFHLAGIVEIGTGNKKKLFKVNVDGTNNILKACQSNHIKRLIYTSSVHAIEELPKDQTMKEVTEFDPNKVKGLYAKTKAIATSLVYNQEDPNLEVVIVHPSGVIGPHDYQLSNISQLFIDFLMGRLTAYMKGGYNFVDVRDVADGIIKAALLGKNKSCYILSGEEITVKELLDTISEYTGKKKIKTKLAFWFIFAMSYFAEIYYKIAKQKPLFTHYSIVVLKSNYHFSNELAKKELGFHVRSIKTSIHDAIEFTRTNFLMKKGKKYIRKSLD